MSNDGEPRDFERAESRPVPAPWHVTVDDEIGGWAVSNCNVPPSRQDPAKGHVQVGTVVRRADAELIVMLRNLAAVDLNRQIEERDGRPGT